MKNIYVIKYETEHMLVWYHGKGKNRIRWVINKSRARQYKNKIVAKILAWFLKAQVIPLIKFPSEEEK